MIRWLCKERLLAIWWSTKSRASIVELLFLKPNWRLLSKLLLVTKYRNLFAISLSKVFDKELFKDMGLYELMLVLFFPGFRLGITMLFLNCWGIKLLKILLNRAIIRVFRLWGSIFYIKYNILFIPGELPFNSFKVELNSMKFIFDSIFIAWEHDAAGGSLVVKYCFLALNC